MRFDHIRHRPPTALAQPRPLIVACAPLRSNVNLSRIVRTAGSCGVTAVVCCGNAKVIGKIARDSLPDDADGSEIAPAELELRTRRTLAPPLRELKQQGYQLVGLEQTTESQSLYDFCFERRTVLVVGNERLGLEAEILGLLDRVVEIPVYGRPLSYNVATAAAMALYEYCRQFPLG